jgi:thiaminase/transcriptional activator TenA
MIVDELRDLAEPALKAIGDHPFWAGLRDGSLPTEVLVYYARQDVDHLLPTFGRAFGRCAAIAYDDAHAKLFAHSILGALGAGEAMAQRYRDLAGQLGLPRDALSRRSPIGPATHAYCAFFTAASASSLAAGVGGLLPMVWFHIRNADDLIERLTPGSRYAAWVEAYHPGSKYRHMVETFLATVNDIGDQLSTSAQERLLQHFQMAARHEWAFVEGAWRQLGWPF